MKTKKLLLNLISLLIFFGCSSEIEYQEIQIKDVIKIDSQFDDSKDNDVLYIWGAPISSSGSLSKFEIKDNIYYFSAPDPGKYEIFLSIETKEGKDIIGEKFNYLALDFISKAEKQYEPSVFPSKELRRREDVSLPFFTVQVYSKPSKKEAISESDKLFDFGFEDVYVEEYTHKGAPYWRVRTGIFNSRIKADKHKQKISKKLKIDSKDLWATEVK